MNLELLQLLPHFSVSSKVLSYTAGFLVAIAATGYAFQVYRAHLHANMATWLMVVIIDSLGLILALATGNSSPAIHVVWVVTDVLICIAIFRNIAHWHWKKLETLSLAACLLSLTLWLVSSSSLSLYAYLIACACTLLPQAIQYWHNKTLARKSAWLWIVNSIALVMTILSVESLTPEYSIVSLGLLTLNLLMVLIAVR
jgi:hypothetical protein